MMRTVRCYLWILFLCSCNSIEKEQALFQIVVNDRIGFIDTSGKILIHPMFRSAGNFSEGVASARIDGKFGFIDKTGAFVIPAQYDYAYDFSEGLALVYIDAHPFFIDKNGRKIIDCSCWFAESFEHGIAKVKTASGKYGFINKKGMLILDTVFEQHFTFRNGLSVAVGVNNNPYSSENRPVCYETALIDTAGKVIIPFGAYKNIEDLRNGYYMAGLVNEKGRDQLSKVVLLDKSGTIIFEHQQQKGFLINNFNCGLISVSLHLPGAEEYGDTDYYYNHLYPAFMNLKGEFVINDTSMVSVKEFSQNRSFVDDPPARGYYMINKNGERISRQVFQSTEDFGFHNGNVIVKVNGMYGLIDTNANFIIKPEYTSLDRTLNDDGLFVFSPRSHSDSDFYGLINNRAEILIAPEFDMIDRTGVDKGILKGRYKGRMSYINMKGAVIWQHGQVQQQALSKLNIDYKQTAYFAAASEAPKGENRGYAVYNNAAEPLSELTLNTDALFAVVVRPDVTDTFEGKYKGIRVVVYNNDTTPYSFAAIDSRLNMIVQAKNKDGQWLDIEELPQSFCGNSYHTLVLKPGEYWHFTTPEYDGCYKTKLRIALKYYDRNDKAGKKRERKECTVYSNEYDGTINPAQLWRSDEFITRGLVNPYYYGEE